MGAIVIHGGRLVDPAQRRNGHCDVVVDGTTVAEVCEEYRGPVTQRIDARGKLVLPGLVDTHVHLASPFGGAQGYRMLARAGVTCALDMAGTAEEIVNGMAGAGSGIAVAHVYPLIPGETVSSRNPPVAELSERIDQAVEHGALGVKILGGHYPLDPDAIAATISLAHRRRCWCAVHAGSTASGSDILGLEELVHLADGLPVHIAHINSYCRGQQAEPLLEAQRAIEALTSAPQVRSESYLALINGADATIADGVPKSNVVKTCLRMGGFPASAEGMEAAIHAGWAQIHGLAEGETRLLPPEEGLARYRQQRTHVGVSFAVNPPSAAIALALARRNDGFVVTAISTDGGAIPRNTTLAQGLALVRFGALSLDDLIRKACLNPALMLGLTQKGHLGVGADADLIVVDPLTAQVELVIARGQIILRGAEVCGSGGELIVGPDARRLVVPPLLSARAVSPAWLEATAAGVRAEAT